MRNPDITEFLARVLSSSETECWRLYDGASQLTTEEQRQRLLGKLEGIETVLGFIDTELTVMDMEMSL